MPEKDKDIESELLFLVELAVSEAADEGQLRRLGQLLEQDESLRELYSRAWLLEVELRQVLQQSPNSFMSRPARCITDGRQPLPFRAWVTRRVSRMHWGTIAATTLLFIVAAAGFVAGRLTDRAVGEVGGDQLALSATEDGGDGNRSATPHVSLATGVSVKLTKATQCVWGQALGRGTQFPVSGMQGGERLELLEGFATFLVSAKDWQADIQIEGPAAIVMTSEGLPELRHGKMLVKTSWSTRGRLSVGLPYAEAYLLPGSEVGVGAFGGTCEVHVFVGAASLKGLWGLDQPLDINPDDAQVVVEGSSLQLMVASDGSLSLREGIANRGMFDVGATVKGGELIVTKEYAEKVIAAEPIAYWRFEEPTNGIVTNMIQDQFHLHVHGDVKFDGLTGNRCLGFPMDDERASHPRFLATTDAISAELGGDYTIEFWMYPSHYHTATLATLVVPELQDSEPSQTWVKIPPTQHGLLVELGGFSGEHALMRPRKMRFVHRSSPSYVGGKTTFSDRIYTVREWQHAVFSKAGDKMHIYRNGEKCGEASVSEGLPGNLVAVIGQISDGRFERPFYGRIDEMAIYDHPLTEDQIRDHYRAVQFVGQSAGKGDRHLVY